MEVIDANASSNDSAQAAVDIVLLRHGIGVVFADTACGGSRALAKKGCASMNPLNFAIVISTTRLSRFGEKAAKWVRGLAENRVAASYEVVDLRDHPLPFFDEPVSPVSRPSPKQEVRRWANRIARFD